MGPANSKLINNTGSKISVMTFNNADTVFVSYAGLYSIEPGQTSEVNAAADAWGLNVAIGYEIVGNQMLWRRWFCPNGATMSLDFKNGSDMQTSQGCEHKGLGFTDMDANTFSTVVDFLGLGIDAAGAAGEAGSTPI